MSSGIRHQCPGLPWREIRVITLDLDDTLWDVMPVIRRAEAALESWFAEHYPRIPERWPCARRQALRRRIVAANAERAHDLTFLRQCVIAGMAEDSGYPAGISEAAFAVFEEQRNRLELFPDALPALKTLSERYRIVAVTNGNARLDKVGIAGYFDAFVSARTAGAAKPDPRIFAAALEAGGRRPGETLHVGDHPEHDVDGARRAGLRTVWVNRRRVPWSAARAPADIEVSDLQVLAKFLAAG